MQTTATGRALWAPRFLGIMRIVIGLLFFQTGLAKLFGWPHVAMFENVQAFQLIWFAGMIELIGGALFMIGLWTRCVAFVLSGEMAFAYFIGHFPHGFFPIVNGGTAAILYCLIYFFYFLVGSGSYSIDNTRT
ncbi:MAG TPA: DoxX family protein [Stellaceae bacterium]|jgi:putative oxidoreductase|nr:DoxX family protein [Stellaceae bacterium]